MSASIRQLPGSKSQDQPADRRGADRRSSPSSALTAVPRPPKATPQERPGRIGTRPLDGRDIRRT
jgi:hypothetical protein